jgi:hypothetical protein
MDVIKSPLREKFATGLYPLHGISFHRQLCSFWRIRNVIPKVLFILASMHQTKLSF